MPPDNPLTEEVFAEGRHLFYDPILPGNNQVSCATCHVQALAFTDGRAKSLEEQALLPIQHPDEMGQDTGGLHMKPDEMQTFTAFLHTLTDEAFPAKSQFSGPFDGGS
ncbi:cytochrome-c peroxidase [Ruegeria arenilitoris]|uniref:cytochrome-c peroxidase n=1 Tax=Ruegeria arenilitoris TaxID=1173585 RepID=UPI003464C9D5